MAIVFSAFTFAQEQPETEKTEKKECSRSCCGTKESKSEVGLETSTGTVNAMVWNKVCPVKGEEIDADAPTVEYNGKVYAFCCPGCDTKFAKNPEKYAKNLSEDGKKFIGKK